MHDDLGNRMKTQYEYPARFYLPKKTYTICRIDGKAFHTMTRGLERPYSVALMDAMDLTGMALCEQLQGSMFAYVQSDEISVLLSDIKDDNTEPWFNGNVQKMASVSASIATAAFNDTNFKHAGVGLRPALFDSRVFTIPDPFEVYNYFLWRQKDAIRNSIQMIGQHYFSPRKLHGVSCEQIKHLLNENYPEWKKYSNDDFMVGRFIEKKCLKRAVEYTDKRTGEKCCIADVVRYEWQKVTTPIFTDNPSWLTRKIQQVEETLPE